MSAGGGSYYGMIISAIGSGMQAYAAWQEQKAIQRQIQDELIRQGRFQGHEFTDFGAGLQNQGYETAQEQMGAGAENRTQGYNSLSTAAPIRVAGLGASAADKAYSSGTGAIRAKLGSYGDWATTQDVQRMRVAQGLARTADQSAADARVFPYHLWKAQHKLDELAAAGSMIAGLGNADLSKYYSSPPAGGTPNYAGGVNTNYSQTGDLNAPYGEQNLYQMYPEINNQADVYNISSIA